MPERKVPRKPSDALRFGIFMCVPSIDTEHESTIKR